MLDKWTPEQAIAFMRDQALEFSHHLNNLDGTDFLTQFWWLAKYSLALVCSRWEEQHLVIHLITKARMQPVYELVHEDAQTLLEASSTASSGLALRMSTSFCRCAGIDYSLKLELKVPFSAVTP